MRVVNGKHINTMDALALADWREQYAEVVIDLGAGDGRFMRTLGDRHAEVGAIGIDLCAGNLSAASRAAPENVLFVVADALALPEELRAVANRVTINFPWGSLLHGLLDGHSGLMAGLNTIAGCDMALEIVVNAGALAEAGWDWEDGSERIVATLCRAGVDIQTTAPLGPADLRRWPTTWAKRLAFGRDPRAFHVRGFLPPSRSRCGTVGGWPARCRLDCEYVSLSAPHGRVSAQPHRHTSGASPQEGGLVARSGTRPAKI